MANIISTKNFLVFITIALIFIYVISRHYSISSPILQLCPLEEGRSLLVNDRSDRWISSALYNELRSYITWRDIYYNSALDQYYFYQDPMEVNKTIVRTSFMTPYYAVKLTVINDMALFQQNTRVAAVLKNPVLVAAPADSHYAHGFLELLGPRFWVLAECQDHASYINPSTIQIYYTSQVLKDHEEHLNYCTQQSDGTFQPLRHWEEMIQSMSSIYPLITFASFQNTTVMFKYMIFTGQRLSRSAWWGYNYLYRKYRSYPLPTQHYRRAYLAYSEWILNNFHLKSKFQLTKSQEELQEKQVSEQIPICNDRCIVNPSQSLMQINWLKRYYERFLIIVIFIYVFGQNNLILIRISIKQYEWHDLFV